VEESEVESSRPGGAARRFPVGPVVAGLVVAIVAVWITVAVATDRDPAETVEAYLDALQDKDVDGALELVSRYGYGVPYGDDAAFLTADAIRDDWWVVSVEEIDREYSSRARVEAVIAGPDGTAKGEFTVSEEDDEWFLSDPFLEVVFPPSPLSYIRVNDQLVPRTAYVEDTTAYSLFPGTYRFYESVPDVVKTKGTDEVVVFPLSDDSRYQETAVVPASLTAERDVVTGVQDAIKDYVDACAEFATPAPANCPFATDGEIDTPAGVRVTELHSLNWTVKTQPAVELTDDRADEYSPGFTVRATEPGKVTLIDTDDKPAKFTVTCDIDVTGFLAVVDADGKVELTLSTSAQRRSGDTFNTCRRNA
jgi:hypothetical protein